MAFLHGNTAYFSVLFTLCIYLPVLCAARRYSAGLIENVTSTAAVKNEIFKPMNSANDYRKLQANTTNATQVSPHHERPIQGVQSSNSTHENATQQSNTIQSPPIAQHELLNETDSHGTPGLLKDNNNTSPKDATGEADKHCCTIPKKIKACLRAPGDGLHKLSLLVESDGDYHVTISIPDFLKAEPPEIDISSRNSKTIQILMVDPVAARISKISNISVASDNEVCSIDVPTTSLGLLVNWNRFAYSTVRTPAFVVGFLVLLIFSAGGGWIYCKYRGKSHRHAADGGRYQELEMGLGNGGSISTSNAAADGWEDNWDDDWEDTEATRGTQTISSNGLASRKSNKGSWETWKD